MNDSTKTPDSPEPTSSVEDTTEVEAKAARALEGQVAVVTGAGHGLGRCLATALADAGAHVVLAGRSKEPLEALAEDLRERDTRPLVVATDIINEIEVRNLIKRTRAEYKRLDILVNNAAHVGPTTPTKEVTGDAWNETLGVNLTGAFFCAKHATSLMEEQGHGTVINVVSAIDREESALRAPYIASKWGLLGLNRAMAAELGPKGIRVNAVLPGAVSGDNFSSVTAARAKAAGTTPDVIRKSTEESTALRRLVTEREVADAILFLASPSASGITGQTLEISGGLKLE